MVGSIGGCKSLAGAVKYYQRQSVKPRLDIWLLIFAMINIGAFYDKDKYNYDAGNYRPCLLHVNEEDAQIERCEKRGLLSKLKNI